MINRGKKDRDGEQKKGGVQWSNMCEVGVRLSFRNLTLNHDPFTTWITFYSFCITEVILW